MLWTSIFISIIFYLFTSLKHDFFRCYDRSDSDCCNPYCYSDPGRKANLGAVHLQSAFGRGCGRHRVAHKKQRQPRLDRSSGSSGCSFFCRCLYAPESRHLNPLYTFWAHLFHAYHRSRVFYGHGPDLRPWRSVSLSAAF